MSPLYTHDELKASIQSTNDKVFNTVNALLCAIPYKDQDNSVDLVKRLTMLQELIVSRGREILYLEGRVDTLEQELEMLRSTLGEKDLRSIRQELFS